MYILSHIANIWYMIHSWNISMIAFFKQKTMFIIFYQVVRSPLSSSHSRGLHRAKACQDGPLFDFLEVHLFARPVKGRGLTQGVFVDALFGRNPFDHSSQLDFKAMKRWGTGRVSGTRTRTFTAIFGNPINVGPYLRKSAQTHMWFCLGSPWILDLYFHRWSPNASPRQPYGALHQTDPALELM